MSVSLSARLNVCGIFETFTGWEPRSQCISKYPTGLAHAFAGLTGAAVGAGSVKVAHDEHDNGFQYILFRSALRARRAAALRADGHIDQDEGGLLRGFAGKREGGQSRYADVQTVRLVRRS